MQLFAGYVGYRFDQLRARSSSAGDEIDPAEQRLREKLWADPSFRYERDLVSARRHRRALYSADVRCQFDQFDCTTRPIVDVSKLRGRHVVHRRSYLDVKLRLGDHLLGDHGDRMAMANSVEVRYPFLSRRVAALATITPPDLKLRGFEDKHLVRSVARSLVPDQIREREKFAWGGPGTANLLAPGALQAHDREMVEYLMSPEKIRKDDVFDPHAVSALRAQQAAGRKFDPNGETDWLMVVLTTGLLTDLFDIRDAA